MIPETTFRLVTAQRETVNLTVDRAVQGVVDEYVRVSQQAADRLSRLLRREAGLLRAGDTLSLAEMAQRERAERLLLTIQRQLADLAERGVLTATSTVSGELVPLAVDYQQTVIRSQLPPDLRTFGVRVSPEVLADVVARAEQRVGYLRRMSEQTARAVNRTIVDGIVVGQNPRDAARDLMRRVGRALDGGITRAERIMRTEMLDAYRNANTVVTVANADVVGEVEWYSAADERTCASCWAMHGERFPVGTPGPDDHPNGRCTFLPVVRSDLAGDYPMGPSKDELWGRLDEQQRLRVLGPTRYGLTDGGPPPRDFSRQVPAGDWRAYRVATPVRELVT